MASFASMVVSDPPELKHMPLYRYNRFFRPMMNRVGCSELEILAVIREPISWLGSWYRYRSRDFLVGRPTSTRDVSFDTFCEAYAKGRRPAFANVGSQQKFIQPSAQNAAVQHLFKYENQIGLQKFLEQRLSTRLSFPHINISPSGCLDLSDKTRSKLHRKCAGEFAIWNAAA